MLEEVLAKAPRKRLPVGEVLHIGTVYCQVLGYLHVQNPPVIFRDVKQDIRGKPSMPNQAIERTQLDISLPTLGRSL